MKIPLSSHPETNLQLLRRSLALYQKVFFRVFLYSLFLAIVAFIPRLVTIITSKPTIFDISHFEIKNLWIILIEFIALVFFTAELWRIRCVVVDEKESMRDDIKIALKKIPYILACSFIQVCLLMAINFMVSLGMEYIIHDQNSLILIDLTRQILLAILIFIQVVAIFYILFAFYFYVPIIVVENKGVFAALQKSVALVWTNWWRTFLIQITPWAVFVLTLRLLQIFTPLRIRIYFLSTVQTPDFLATIITILIFACFITWAASLLILQLRDLELRKALGESAIISE